MAHMSRNLALARTAPPSQPHQHPGSGLPASGADPSARLQRSNLQTVVSLLPYLWPSGNAGAKARVVVALLFMLLAKFATVYVPLSLLQGWIHQVARFNPLTFLVESGRGFIEGEPTQVAAAFSIALALLAVFAVWARTGLARAERAG